jgi:hypothetical protein
MRGALSISLLVPMNQERKPCRGFANSAVPGPGLESADVQKALWIIPLTSGKTVVMLLKKSLYSTSKGNSPQEVRQRFFMRADNRIQLCSGEKE